MGEAVVTRGWEKWSAPEASNTGERYAETVVVPSEDLAGALLERLITRSNSAEGFDRAALKTIDRDAWGITES